MTSMEQLFEFKNSDNWVTLANTEKNGNFHDCFRQLNRLMF